MIIKPTIGTSRRIMTEGSCEKILIFFTLLRMINRWNIIYRWNI